MEMSPATKQAADALYLRLMELGSTVTDSCLTVSGRRFFISKLASTHPFHNLQFYTVVFNENLRNLFDAAPYTEAPQAVHQAVYWMQQSSQQSSGVLNAEQQQLLTTHIVAVDVQNGEYFLWSTQDQKISEWSVKAYFERFTKDQVGEIKRESKLSRIVFDPYRGVDKQWEDSYEGNTVVTYNAFRPPRWQTFNFTEAMGQETEQYPPLFLFFLRNLLPIVGHQAVVLDWLALAVFDRPHTYLSLRGIRGNGKTSFVYLVFHLVGNFYNALTGIITDYNADLKNKRIIGVNDNPVIGTREGNMMRKSFTDPITTFNEKHVQTTVSDKQHASLIIGSNPTDKFYVLHDDRKIVSPQLTDSMMEEWTTPEIRAWFGVFQKTLEGALPVPHLEFLAAIGKGLFSRFVQNKPSVDVNLKAGFFWHDVVQSLTAFKRFVLQRCIYWDDEEGKLEYDILKSEFAMDNRSSGHIETWQSLRAWAITDFVWMEHRICVRFDERDKILWANPSVKIKE